MSWNTPTGTEATAHGDAANANAGASASRSVFRRVRRIAAASLIAVAALSLTACQSGEDGAKATKVSSSPDSTDMGSSSGGETVTPGENGGSDGGKQSDAGTEGSTGGGSASNTGKGGAGAGSGSATGSGSAHKGKGVNGTFNGVLNYLAPGKLTVSPKSGAEQAFFVSEETKTLGAAGICASNGNVTVDDNGYGTSPCTEAQLEKAAKMNSVEVRVTLQGGIATKIVEHYHQ
ncbi:hypothetical protein [Streptomyces halobius]|uniref:Lipoprotein n=1 Tax=Streptomyces halobius TaxID=2879846 RepID=A0ABY4M158_9ACTN|nr:hypothetical protein [Streptomyces halobius]UQA91491.1 hypothetical protein K9S39_06050 [Streptomyces halobius]